MTAGQWAAWAAICYAAFTAGGVTATPSSWRKKPCPRCGTKTRPRLNGTPPPHEFRFAGPEERYYHWVTCDGTREGFDRATGAHRPPPSRTAQQQEALTCIRALYDDLARAGYEPPDA